MNMSFLKTLALAALLCGATSAFAQEDWARNGRYAQTNAQITENPKAVLLGDSITDNWYDYDPAFFADNNFAGRGISGQTTSQILVRMREDVVNLHPKYVVILAGINDIAHNPGHAISVSIAVGSVKSMCEVARANGIKPIVCSLLATTYIPWREEVGDVSDEVAEFNSMLKEYARKNRIKYVDYNTLLAGEDGKIRPEYAPDNVHPSIEGYKLMESLLLEYIK